VILFLPVTSKRHVYSELLLSASAERLN